MRSPCVKGTDFEPVVADVQRLLEEGWISREELEVRLGADEIELLEEKIVANKWYPMATHGRLLGLLGELKGDDEHGFFVERGRQTAERLLSESGQDGEDAGTEPPDTRAPGDWVGKTLLAMAARLYNHGRWTWLAPESGAGEFCVEITEAETVPEPVRHQIEGMLRFCLEQAAGSPPIVASSQPSRDRIEYRFQAQPASA